MTNSISLSSITVAELETILKAALAAGELVTNSDFNNLDDERREFIETNYEAIAESEELKAYFGNCAEIEELTLLREYRYKRFHSSSAYPLLCEAERVEYILDRTHGNWADYSDSCRMLFMHCSDVHDRRGGDGRVYDWLGFGFKSRFPMETLQKFVPNGYELRVK